MTRPLALASALIFAVACVPTPPSSSSTSKTEGAVTGTGTLSTISGFSNPGALNMYSYVPSGTLSGALVVAMHGCTQSASDYMNAGWNSAADVYGFVVLYPEQTTANNANKCFNFFDSGDTVRNGESASIAAAIQQTVDTNHLDAQRVYVTGLSAGGAMTAVMLADYPDKGTSHTSFTGFNGGAIMAGLPYNTACTGQTEDTCPSSSTSYGDAFTAMASGKPSVTAQQWGDRVRATSPNATQWPRVSVWGGTSDTTVAPANADELVEQWSNLHGLSTQTNSETIDGATHLTYADGNGTVQVEQYRIPNMTHGTAIDPNFEFGSGTGAMCGTAASYILSEGICSTFYALVFWGEVSSTDGSEQTGTTSGSSGTGASGSSGSSLPSATCTAVTDTNSAHVAAGRAVDLWGYAYTVGTYEVLGLDSTTVTTTLHEQYGIWLEGACP